MKFHLEHARRGWNRSPTIPAHGPRDAATLVGSDSAPSFFLRWAMRNLKNCGRSVHFSIRCPDWSMKGQTESRSLYGRQGINLDHFGPTNLPDLQLWAQGLRKNAILPAIDPQGSNGA